MQLCANPEAARPVGAIRGSKGAASITALASTAHDVAQVLLTSQGRIRVGSLGAGEVLAAPPASRDQLLQLQRADLTVRRPSRV